MGTKTLEAIGALIEQQGAGLLGPKFALVGHTAVKDGREIVFLAPSLTIRLTLESSAGGRVRVRTQFGPVGATAHLLRAFAPGMEGWHLLSVSGLEANAGRGEVEELMLRVRIQLYADRRSQALLSQ
jgi:hypothetical protein